MKNIIPLLFFYLSVTSCNRSGESTEADNNILTKIDSFYNTSDELTKINKVNDAKKFIDFGLTLSLKANSNSNIIKGYHLLMNHMNSLDFKDSASFYGEKALSYFNPETKSKIDIKETINVLFALSNLYIETGNYSISYKYINQCIQLAEDINDKNFRINFYGNLAYCYYTLGQFELAKFYFLKKLEFTKIETQGIERTFTLQGIFRDIGLSHFNLKEYKTAICYYDSALEVLEVDTLTYLKHKKSIDIATGIIKGNKGQALGGLQKYTEAIIELKENIKINNQIGYDNIDATSSLIALATIYLQRGEIDAFEKTMKTTDSLYESSSKNVYFNRLIKLKALAFEKYTKNTLGYELVKKFIALNDSTNISVNKNNLRYKIGMKDINNNTLKIDILNTQTLENKKRFYQSVTAGIIVTIFLITVLIFLVNSRAKSEKLKKLFNQNARNQIALENSNLDMQKLVQEKNNILSIVAHDLKSPLSSIQGITKLIEFYLVEHKIEDEELNSFLSYLNASTNHMNAVTDDLLEISSLENSNIQLTLHNTNIRDLLQKVKHIFEIKAQQKYIEINIESVENVEHNVNEKKFERALGNLVSNAIKFSNPNSQILISASKIDSNLVIRIQDKGIGISSESLSVIFDRFTKAKNVGTNGEKPVGLGLSIVKQIVEKHNGTIEVESELGIGTTFTISIPNIS